ncbi:LAMI_0B08856g1_1 [Lachancea mirantina]|uniref:LAMI_0B08856g1_1 n=1 Tax=Lachancea mirantina TaxID=1230905 RepID=A0A1G4IY87_9SACH|nr:LAMI_0B08856g1_1 [Lachancea mirantina]
MTSSAIFKDKIHAVFVAEIVFYSLAFLATLASFARRGKMTSIKLYLLLLISLKLAGTSLSLRAAVEIVNSGDGTMSNGTTVLFIVGGVLTSVASAPLIHCTRILLPPLPKKRHPKQAHLERFLANLSRLTLIAAIATSAAGYGQLSGSTSTAEEGAKIVQASSILFPAGYLMLLAAGSLAYKTTHSDWPLIKLYGVAVAFPFFILRFIYIIISAFSLTGNLLEYHKFSVLNGDWRPYLGMFVVMDFCIVIIYLVMAYTAPPSP